MTGNSNDPPTTLFVGDLSIFCTENDLLMLFSNFGAVPKVQVKRGKQGEALQYGFVVLPRSVAIVAAERVNGIKLLGRRLRIKLKLSHDSLLIICQERNRNGWAQIHFSFITHQVTHAIGEEMLDHVFSSIGAIADVAIKQHSITLDPPRQTAYGFIFFYEVEAAQRAIQEMKHVQIDGVMFDCNWSNQRDADADARRKLLARQQKPILPPGSYQQQGSPQYSPARRSHSSSPVIMGLGGYDLSMAMEGLTMGPAGLTMSQPMANSMYGPPLPPSPIGLGIITGMNMDGAAMNYPAAHQQYYPPQASPPQQHQQQAGRVYMTGPPSPQVSANSSMYHLPVPSQMSIASTDSYSNYSPSTSVMPESSTFMIAGLDGPMLQQHGMYPHPPLPQQQLMPRYPHHGNAPHLPHPLAHHSPSDAYGMNMMHGGGGQRGYIPSGIASECDAGAGYYVLGGVGSDSAQSFSTTLSSSSTSPRQVIGSER